MYTCFLFEATTMPGPEWCVFAAKCLDIFSRTGNWFNELLAMAYSVVWPATGNMVIIAWWDILLFAEY